LFLTILIKNLLTSHHIRLVNGDIFPGGIFLLGRQFVDVLRIDLGQDKLIFTLCQETLSMFVIND
jgi:hypothetical protein